LVQVASTATVERLHLNVFGHAYLGLGAVVIVVLFYLGLAAQITQSSYDIARLQDQQSQLLAAQDQLQYQEVTLHAPAQVQQAAVKSGMKLTAPTRYVLSRGAGIDLQAPIGASAGDSTPLWQQMMAAVVTRVVGARDVMAATR
jgi:hypothetical protein